MENQLNSSDEQILEQVVVKEKSNKKLIAFIISIFLLIIAFLIKQNIELTNKLEEISNNNVQIDKELVGIDENYSDQEVEEDLQQEWETYRNIAKGYIIKYPSNLGHQADKCTKLDYQPPYSCIFSNNFKQITEDTSPGDGGVDTITIENEGMLISIFPIDKPYPIDDIDEGFCRPGGSSVISNCRKELINGFEFALREIGPYGFDSTILNAILIDNNQAKIEFSLNFSKDNKGAEIVLFKEILETLELN